MLLRPLLSVKYVPSISRDSSYLRDLCRASFKESFATSNLSHLHHPPFSHPLIHTRPIRQQAFPSRLLGRRPYLCNIQTNAAGQPFLYIEQLPFTALNHKPHFKRWKGCFQNTQTLCKPFPCSNEQEKLYGSRPSSRRPTTSNDIL